MKLNNTISLKYDIISKNEQMKNTETYNEKHIFIYY